MTAAVSLRGLRRLRRRSPDRLRVAFRDGSTQIVGDPPSVIVADSRPRSTRRHAYVVWEVRHVVYSPWRVSVGDIDLGTVTLPEYLPYHVAEVKAVLRTTPGGR